MKQQLLKTLRINPVGWVIYPLGYIAPVVETDAIREVLYTIADIINKVGLGVLVLQMARVKSGEKVS